MKRDARRVQRREERKEQRDKKGGDRKGKGYFKNNSNLVDCHSEGKIQGKTLTGERSKTEKVQARKSPAI